MSTYLRELILLTLLALLAACGGKPQPEPEPVVVEAEAAEAVVEPEPVDIHQERYEQALELLRQADTETALVMLEQLRVDAPEKPRLFTNLGLAYFSLDRSEAAEAAFNEAINRDATDAVAHNHLGILKRREGHFEAALERYQRAIQIDARYASAHLNLGILFDLYLQDLEMALQHYQVYRSLNADDNPQLDGWIVDIQRRLKTATS